MGRELRGIYHLGEDRIYVYDGARTGRVGTNRAIEGLDERRGGRVARRFGAGRSARRSR